MKRETVTEVSSCFLFTPARFSRSNHDAHERLGMYEGEVNHLLATYATFNMIIKNVGTILLPFRMQGAMEIGFAQTSLEKVYWSGNVGPESQSNEIFFEGLVEVVRKNMCVCWALNRQPTLSWVELFADFLHKFNETQILISTSAKWERSTNTRIDKRKNKLTSVMSLSSIRRSNRGGSTGDSSRDSWRSRHSVGYYRIWWSRKIVMDKCLLGKEHLKLMAKHNTHFDWFWGAILIRNRIRPTRGHNKKKEQMKLSRTHG